MSGRPLPIPDPQTEPFWAAARSRELRLPRCPVGHRFVAPWLPCCPDCLRSDLRWEVVSGTGTVWSHCVMWDDYVAGFQAPYVVAEIAIAEQPDVLLSANILGSPPEAVEIGAPVRVVFEERDQGFVVPQFALVEAG